LKTTVGSVLTLSPPPIIDRLDLDRALDILAESIDNAEAVPSS
jgi:4-aminobutyrate aminotransferase-like enzyme